MPDVSWILDSTTMAKSRRKPKLIDWSTVNSGIDQGVEDFQYDNRSQALSHVLLVCGAQPSLPRRQNRRGETCRLTRVAADASTAC